MTKEEENKLLLRDLSARLPYEVIIKAKTKFTLKEADSKLNANLYAFIENCWAFNDSTEIEYIKPYLRPMSSMTSVEVLEYISLKESIVASDDITYFFETDKSIDWLNAHHFDYRGLIEKGLAIVAPEKMYEI